MGLGLARAPGLLALQLRQFRVDRAQTPLTGDVRPPSYHEGAPPGVGPPLATGGVLEIGEPSMDGVQHCGSPSPLSEPHGCGPLTDLPGAMLPWSGPRWRPPACPTWEEGSRGPPHTPPRSAGVEDSGGRHGPSAVASAADRRVGRSSAV